MQAARAVDKREVIKKDARLVGLFLDYLTEKGAVTQKEAAEFEVYHDIVRRLTVLWDPESDDDTPTTMFFPSNDDHRDTSCCPGECCASIGKAKCKNWYPIVVFI